MLCYDLGLGKRGIGISLDVRRLARKPFDVRPIDRVGMRNIETSPTGIDQELGSKCGTNRTIVSRGPMLMDCGHAMREVRRDRPASHRAQYGRARCRCWSSRPRRQPAMSSILAIVFVAILAVVCAAVPAVVFAALAVVRAVVPAVAVAAVVVLAVIVAAPQPLP